MDKALDPRVVRTQRLLLEALKDIIVEEGYESVTIREIVRRAGINRSTFYLHFRDKHDILARLHNDILEELTESFNYQFNYETVLDDFKNRNKPVKSNVAMFKHIQKYSDLYLHMLDEKEFRDSVVEILKDEVLRYRRSVWDAIFMASGVLGVLLHWLENEMNESVLEMSLWLTEMMLYPLGQLE